MTTFKFAYLNKYKNHGQNAENSVAYALTGEDKKADNIAHDKGADCLHYQIKSARATVCKGANIREYLADDASTAYIYATKDGTAYIMSRSEYISFVNAFGTLTRDSAKNGGAEKIRLKHETPAMLEWLRRQA